MDSKHTGRDKIPMTTMMHIERAIRIALATVFVIVGLAFIGLMLAMAILGK